MMTLGKELADNVDNIIEAEEENANSMRIIAFNKQSIIFLVEQYLNPRQRRLLEKFEVNISERWCDCGKLQKLHMSCSHAITTCKYIHVYYK